MQTALISALTAAIVTLLIEYTAKPQLEVRKDRVVAAARLRRDVEAQLSALNSKILMLHTSTTGSYPRKTWTEPVGQLDEAIERLLNDLVALKEVLPERQIFAVSSSVLRAHVMCFEMRRFVEAETVDAANIEAVRIGLTEIMARIGEARRRFGVRRGQVVKYRKMLKQAAEEDRPTNDEPYSDHSA